MNLNDSALGLLKLLETALQDELERPTAISYSGGLDSSIVAAIALKKVRLTGYCAGLPGSYDLVNAEKNAELLGLELRKVELSKADIIELIPKVERITGLNDRMNIGIAIPLYASCLAAARDGFESILCGQGADELFAGYARYLKMDKEKLGLELEKDFLALGSGGWKRDSSIAKAAGMRLASPFLEQRVSALAKKLPLEFKTDRVERKIILREVASLLGLDREICEQKKKAVQYGSGVARVLEKADL